MTRRSSWFEVCRRMASKMNRMLSSSSRMGSQVYPQEPTPMHFTQLFYPKATAMPPPATHTNRCRRRGCGGLGCCCASICATLCSLLFTLVFILGLAALIAWLVLRPIYAPKYSFGDLQIKTFNLTPQNTLNANIVYNIMASNRNGKIDFKHNAIAVHTSYGGQVFGQASIPAFSQGHRNVTTLTSELVVNNFEFVPASLGTALATDVNRGSVALHARGSAKVRVKVGAITSFAVRVRVDCDFTVKPPTATSPGSVLNKTCVVSK